MEYHGVIPPKIGRHRDTLTHWKRLGITFSPGCLGLADVVALGLRVFVDLVEWLNTVA